jgi:hypothetical protein
MIKTVTVKKQPHNKATFMFKTWWISLNPVSKITGSTPVSSSEDHSIYYLHHTLREPKLICGCPLLIIHLHPASGNTWILTLQATYKQIPSPLQDSNFPTVSICLWFV